MSPTSFFLAFMLALVPPAPAAPGQDGTVADAANVRSPHPCVAHYQLSGDLESLSEIVKAEPIKPKQQSLSKADYWTAYEREIDIWYCALDALSAIPESSVEDVLGGLLVRPDYRLAAARKLADRGSELGFNVLEDIARAEMNCSEVAGAASSLLVVGRASGVLGYFRVLELDDGRCLRRVENAYGLATLAAEMPDFDYVARVLDLRTAWPDRFGRVGVGLLERGARVPRWQGASCLELRRLAAEGPPTLSQAAAVAGEKYCPRLEPEP